MYLSMYTCIYVSIYLIDECSCSPKICTRRFHDFCNLKLETKSPLALEWTSTLWSDQMEGDEKEQTVFIDKNTDESQRQY